MRKEREKNEIRGSTQEICFDTAQNTSPTDLTFLICYMSCMYYKCTTNAVQLEDEYGAVVSTFLYEILPSAVFVHNYYYYNNHIFPHY
jgi:hypothetical protein